ncbi:hypothetical protein ACR79B_11190 [Sphingobacterium spiritivorum]|uniref:hypothetical protein n=1 Tax=Sphingobacterium spiritivorum TaxID=258 RepID=UPI003DA57AC9
MTDSQVRLINIIQDRFKIPVKSDGNNILMKHSQLSKMINDIWPQSENWTGEDLAIAILETEIPYITNSENERVYLLLAV